MVVVRSRGRSYFILALTSEVMQPNDVMKMSLTVTACAVRVSFVIIPLNTQSFG